MDSADNLPKKSKNGKIAFSPEIEAKIIEACGSGFTIEKAGGLVGVNPSTIRTWIQRKPSFGDKVETARKTYELSLLKSIHDAGEKSWQARAWILERACGYAQPSARLQVSGNVEHGMNEGFAKLLAGLASRRAEKKAQVIECQDVKPIEDSKSKYNSYCATDNSQTIATPTPKNSGKPRKVSMRRRKPRAESLKNYPTTTPPAATPPPPFPDV
mgnify:CR=1 FL=1